MLVVWSKVVGVLRDFGSVLEGRPIVAGTVPLVSDKT